MAQYTTLSLIDNKLLFNPGGYRDFVYGIVIKNLQKNWVTHYEVTCTCVRYIGSGTFLLTLNRSPVFINNKLPAKKLYEMAEEMAKCIYPVTIAIGKENKIISIVNHKEIIDRSKLVLEKLTGYFEGDVAEDCFSTFQKQINNENAIINGLQNDLFYTLLFLPLYAQYSSAYKLQIPIDITLNNKKLSLGCTAQLNPEYTADKVAITVLGTQDFVTVSVNYQLYPEDHTVFHIKGLIDCIEPAKPNERLEFEIWHLNTEERNTTGKKSFRKDYADDLKESQSIIVWERANPPKKSFWNLFK